MIVLAIFSLSLCCCGNNSNYAVPSAEPVPASAPASVSLELSKTETVFHGVHFRAPSFFVFQKSDNQDEYYSKFADNAPIQLNDDMCFYVQSMADLDDVFFVDGCYTSEGAHIYF